LIQHFKEKIFLLNRKNIYNNKKRFYNHNLKTRARYSESLFILSLSLVCAATRSGKYEHSAQCQYHEQSLHTSSFIIATSYGSGNTRTPQANSSSSHILTSDIFILIFT
jgi:hypothetical protein